MRLHTNVQWHARQSPRLLAGSAAVVVLAIAATFTFVGGARADDPPVAPTPAPIPMGTAADISATIAGYGSFVVKAGQSLSATVTVTNAATDPVAGVSLSLAVTQQPLSTSEELAQFFDDPSSLATRVVKTIAVGTPELDEDDKPLDMGTLAGSASPQVRIAASSKDLGLPAGTAGVYGVITSYGVGETKVTVDSSAMTWLDTAVASLPVTAIATIAGQPGRVSALLSAAAIDGVTVAIDPTALTSASPVDSLEGREVFLLPATHPDVASLAHAGDTLLTEFALEQSRTHGWTGAANAPWLAVSAVADRSVAIWAEEAGAAATLFDPTHASASPSMPAVDGGVPAAVHVPAKDGHTASLLVPDATLSNLVASFRPGEPAGPSRIVAESALLAFAGDGSQGVVVAPGLSWVVDADGPSANLAALMAAPWVTVRPVRDAITDSHYTKGNLPDTQGVKQDVPAEHIDALSSRLTALTQLSATTANPRALLVPGGRMLLNAVPTTARGDAERQAAAFDSSTRVLDATLSAVGIVQSSDVNLIATSGEVPITVHNDLGVATTVKVVMRSTSPKLRVRDYPVITIEARSEGTAMIPVEAVSSADVAINVWLTNPAGDPVSTTQNFTMRVRADWGNAATAIFTVMLVLVLIGGLIRTIRRGRKDTRTGPGELAEDAELSDAAADASPLRDDGSDQDVATRHDD